ncbi:MULTISPECIES: competence type IV pilus minor pilin ComGG [unclassified Enterococcus]|uniref:competence type IV pilus minor pilin ComGG n=1 Tax=unclassified Enterococcus TaxID=2608891 RepID=UPI0015561B87|nr:MULTISPECIES: competence type IV pilus minor pilin ComGG [unclassified Enterococcus]MBS7577272.1 hypothetical protein [Enterococcus sp. MMGLQ5-2]MBS7584635.1 hypothetical protein [Enterococcus sp. MMGLQ5-1]NPD12490.1 hypothetical protein [Enterococcus sp. MMGLQ5-1]NPD37106.1 hypothetical protein [Enterococcus sp. MMGLQ5-2]
MALKASIIGMLNKKQDGGILLIVLILFSIFFLTFNFCLELQQDELRFLKLQRLSTRVGIMEVMAKRYLIEKNLRGEGAIRFENGLVEYSFINQNEAMVEFRIFPDRNNRMYYWSRQAILD